MDRRRFLGILTAGFGSGLSGCAVDAPTSARGATREQDRGSTDSAEPLGRSGHPPDICTEDPYDYTGIHSIVDPAVANDWRDHPIDRQYRLGERSGLTRDQTVIGIRTGASTRAYPLTVLWKHEVVNDVIDGSPILVTYCPLCRSGMVARRVVDGDPTVFWASGLLWIPPAARERTAVTAGRVFGADPSLSDGNGLRHNRNLVLVDARTGSFWSQILARAICGPKEGTFLTIEPSSVTTWGEWIDEHPETDVLLPPPASLTNGGRPADVSGPPDRAVSADRGSDRTSLVLGSPYERGT